MRKRLFVCLLIALLLVLIVPVMAAPEGPQITLQPQNYQYPQYSVAMYTVKATGTNLRATWYIEYEGKTYNISDSTNGMEPWEYYAGETYGPSQSGNTFTCFFGGIEEGLNGAEIWCVIEDGHYEVTSDRAIITVQGEAMPPEILQMPARLTVKKGANAEIRCVAKSDGGAQLAFQWYETTIGKLQDIRAIFGEESDYMFCDTQNVGTRYYVCCVTSTDGGCVYSSVLPVTVEEDAEPVLAPAITTKSLPKAIAGQEYIAAIGCSDPEAEFAVYHNPGKANDFDKIGGLTLHKDGRITGIPTNPGSYEFAVCAAGVGGEDYAVFTVVVEKPAEIPTEETTQPTAETVPVTTEPMEETHQTEPMPTQTTAPEVQPGNDNGDRFPWVPVLLAGVVVVGCAVVIAVAVIVIVFVKKKK